MWRNGRRKRLKIARETMWVRVPPSAPIKQSGLFSGSGLLYFCCKSYLCVLRENADDGIGRGYLAGKIQMGINIAGGADIAVPQPLLNFLQAHAVGVKQACAAMPLRYNYDKPEKPRISRVFGYLARFFILFQTEKSSREVIIS